MIVVVGLSHRTAPIGVREQLVIPEADIPGLLQNLVDCPSIAESLLVSTCNRVELVVAAHRGNRSDLNDVAQQARDILLARAPRASDYLYAHLGVQAVRHVFRVAASLDSLVLGEPQILGQIKDAFEFARRVGTVGPALHRAIARAIHAAKLVRTETSIGSGQVSVPTVAVDLARQIFGELKRHVVLLVGSGEMAENVARLLQGAGARLLVIGRNAERVAELSRAVEGEPKSWSELRSALIESDVVITSTSAPHHVIEYEMVSGLRRSRRGRSLFFIDLAVPRDVEPRVGELDGTFLYNIDDFSHLVADSVSSREREAARAEELVAREVEGYERWAESEQATPTIVALRRRLGGALQAELDRSLRGRLKHLGPEERQALSKMLDAALNKMLHLPTMRLRELAGSKTADSYEDEQLTSALHELFALAEVSAPAEADEAESDAAADAAADAGENRLQVEPCSEPEPMHDRATRGVTGTSVR